MIKLFLSLCLVVLFQSCSFISKPLIEQLKELPGVVSVEEIKLDSSFGQQFELYFEQPIDHNNPMLGHFNQRVIVTNIGLNQPVVAVLEGYRIWNGKREELTQIINANQVNIEHRFFKDSKPDSIPWEKLTIWQAATDQHLIINALQQIYHQPWVSTGISKGGQTTMYHRSFYPADVAASVAYVAPLNFEREDARIYEFLKTVGSDEDRTRIYDFQCLCFEKFEMLLSLLKQKSMENNWHFDLGFEKTLQYSILEYSFAFWQWGRFTSDEIPGAEASNDDLYNHLNAVSGFTFFEANDVEQNRPFFWAALTEIGMYGYQTEPFKKYLGQSPDFTFEFTLPEGVEAKFQPTKMQEVKNFLDTEAKNMLFIVGGLDTWGATSYTPSGNNNLVRIILPNGHHGTRIKNFPKKERENIYSLLEEWMQIKINDPFEAE
ncbi:MAG: S28 family serine protease [Salinivirgaceae bacterium]|jgi:hypothetical protein